MKEKSVITVKRLKTQYSNAFQAVHEQKRKCVQDKQLLMQCYGTSNFLKHFRVSNN